MVVKYQEARAFKFHPSELVCENFLKNNLIEFLKIEKNNFKILQIYLNWFMTLLTDPSNFFFEK